MRFTLLAFSFIIFFTSWKFVATLHWKVYWHYFFNSICSLHISVSHFSTFHNIANILMIIVLNVRLVHYYVCFIRFFFLWGFTLFFHLGCISLYLHLLDSVGFYILDEIATFPSHEGLAFCRRWTLFFNPALVVVSKTFVIFQLSYFIFRSFQLLRVCQD